MSLALSVHPFGDDAFVALARTVRQAKGADALALVTVIVDRGAVGLVARRRLAASPGGVANVRFVTWPRLAADLAAPWLATTDRRAMTAAMELEAVRSVLLEAHAGPLAAAADQPATVRAVARTCRELAAAPAAALDALASQSARSAEVVAVARALRTRLRGAFDTADLFAAAAAGMRSTPGRPSPTGPVVAYLPDRMGPGECSLLEALATRTTVSVIAGSTGDGAADAPVRALAARLGVAPGNEVARGNEGVPGDEGVPGNGVAPGNDNGAAGTGSGGGPRPSGPSRTWVRSAPSADAEVLMALRYLLRRNAEGVPLERMALLHGGSSPYPVLVQDAVADAGIPVHGPGSRALSATVAGRVLLGALALPDRDWRRDDVAAWLASGPLLHGDRLVPSTEWDALSCEAGVVAGLVQWRERLAAHATMLWARAELLAEAPPDADGARQLAAACRLDATGCGELWRFLDGLAGRIAGAPRSWDGWSGWAGRLLTDLVGGASRRGTWPPRELAAFDAVLAAVGSLGALDWIGGPAPRAGDFRAALVAELDRPAPQTTRFGQGLLVGPIAVAVGVELDVACVVGMVDGAFLAGAPDDVLVPDRERADASPAVPLRSATHLDGRRAYLAAMAGAAERVLSYPRGDQRTGRELRPARAVLDALAELAPGTGRLHASDVRWGAPEGVPTRAFEFVRSFAEAVRDEHERGEPVSVADWELRSLARWRGAHGGLGGHFLAGSDDVLIGALAARRARRSLAFTRFDGLVEGGDVPSPAGGAPQSATGVEAYARCPRSYLFGALLGLVERPAPEAVLQLSPIERGVVIHRVLEQLVAGERGRDGGAARSVEEVERRMLELAGVAFADLEARGCTGHPVLWAIERARILGDLRQFVRDDDAYQKSTGAVPVAVEEQFGWGEDPGVAVEVGEGRVVRFRGRIDRVDVLPGGALCVVDYKTGRPFDAPAPEDPLAGGTRLQLPVYALAARQRHGPRRAVTAGYWFVGSRPAPAGIALDDALVDRLGHVVETSVGGIERGLFPANPGRSDPSVDERQGHCRTCPFDRMCPPDRVASWGRKRMDPSLDRYRQMAEPA